MLPSSSLVSFYSSVAFFSLFFLLFFIIFYVCVCVCGRGLEVKVILVVLVFTYRGKDNERDFLKGGNYCPFLSGKVVVFVVCFFILCHTTFTPI